MTADSWTELWGHKISHNSYNAPLSVNSFKWGNKVKITCGDDEITDADLGYNESFKTIIKMHQGLEKKRGENNGYDAYMSKTSKGTNVDNNYWGRDGKSNISNAVAFQVNETFIFTCAGDMSGADNYISTGNAPATWTEKFNYGHHNFDDGKVTFSNNNAVWILAR